jgi:hypothetical protein
MNLDQIRSALPIHKGEPYPGPATKSRDPKLLGELRSGALVSLIEMARWQSSGHAYDARILLGRIAGIEEKRLEQLAKEDDVDEIIGALPIRP